MHSLVWKELVLSLDSLIMPKFGVPILIVGIIYFAFIGYKFLPNKEGSDERNL